MKLYDDKKGEIMVQLCMAFWYKVILLFLLSCHRIISYFDINYIFVCHIISLILLVHHIVFDFLKCMSNKN